MVDESLNGVLALLKREYLGILPERIGEIEKLVLQLPESDDVENLLRSVHSMKGSAGIYGFHIFTKICHHMEDMMTVLINAQNIYRQDAVKALLVFCDLQYMALNIIVDNGDNFSVLEEKLLKIQMGNTASKPQKVLIVEPSRLHAEIIYSNFLSNRYQATIVNDGLVALENLLMQNFHAVITAMEVPTLNGEAILSALRLSKGKNKNITAILVTTKAADSIERADLFNHVVNRSVLSDGTLSKLLN